MQRSTYFKYTDGRQGKEDNESTFSSVFDPRHVDEVKFVSYATVPLFSRFGRANTVEFHNPVECMDVRVGATS